MNTSMCTYLQFLQYSKLDRWDVKHYKFHQQTFANSVLLSELLQPYNVNISKNEILKNNWSIISKINFAGQLFLRKKESAESIKGNLHLIDGETLIYSKINVRHGCVYFHPSNATPFGVSSEYPAYKLNSQKVIGDYLVLVLRSSYFKNALSAKTSGIAKARVKPTEFLNIEIPLPSLGEQKKLIQQCVNSLQNAANIDLQIISIEDEICSYLQSILGAQKTNNSNQKSKLLEFCQFKNIDKWGYDFIKEEKSILTTCNYTSKRIYQLCRISSGGTPSRGRKDYYGGNIPWVKTGELQNNLLVDTEEKITKLGLENSSAKLYPKGSLLIAMYGATIGKTAKLGIDATTNQACAVLFNIDNKQVLTDYLWIYLQSQTDNFKAMAYGGAQPNINAGIIANYPIPLPPLYVQNEIVEHITRLRKKQKDLQQKSLTLRQQATQQFEQIIFN